MFYFGSFINEVILRKTIFITKICQNIIFLSVLNLKFQLLPSLYLKIRHKSFK